MYELICKNEAGEKFNLSNTDLYTVFKIDGLDPVKASINTSSNATTDGSTINSTRIPERNIVIYLKVEGSGANRIKLYSIFPTEEDVTLYLKTPERDVYIVGKVEDVSCDPHNNPMIAQISILCPNPYFKDVNKVITYFTEINPLFESPFSIPSTGMEFSTFTTNIRKSIINYGEQVTSIEIELFAIGEVVNPIIYDVFKKTHIELKITLQSNDKIIINTSTGDDKEITLVRNGVKTDILGCFRGGSTWLMLYKGDNVFTYNCDSGSSNLQVKFENDILYRGM